MELHLSSLFENVQEPILIVLEQPPALKLVPELVRLAFSTSNLPEKLVYMRPGVCRNTRRIHLQQTTAAHLPQVIRHRIPGDFVNKLHYRDVPEGILTL